VGAEKEVAILSKGVETKPGTLVVTEEEIAEIKKLSAEIEDNEIRAALEKLGIKVYAHTEN